MTSKQVADALEVTERVLEQEKSSTKKKNVNYIDKLETRISKLKRMAREQENV